MATIKVYGMLPSTFTRTVLLAAQEKGIDYELVMMRPMDIGALNPFLKIPAMSHGDLTLFESGAILRYFERVFGGPKLWPDEPRAAAMVDQWAGAVSDSLVNSALRYMANRFGFLPVPDQVAQQFLARTRDFLPHFDRQLGKSRFLAGERLTAADLYLAPLLFYFPDIPELKAILDAAPNCKRWMGEMASRPSVKATEPTQKPKVAA
jgi:glutathione S-transferase